MGVSYVRVGVGVVRGWGQGELCEGGVRVSCVRVGSG